jgi:hypothetical protein
MFSFVAGTGLGVPFPPTVILCLTALAIALSTDPGLLTRQPNTSRQASAGNSFHAPRIIPPFYEVDCGRKQLFVAPPCNSRWTIFPPS